MCGAKMKSGIMDKLKEAKRLLEEYISELAQAMEYSDETLDTIFKQADEVKL